MAKKNRSKTNIKNDFKVVKNCQPTLYASGFESISSTSIVDLHYYRTKDPCVNLVDVVDHFTGKLLAEGFNEPFCDKHFTQIEPKDHPYIEINQEINIDEKNKLEAETYNVYNALCRLIGVNYNKSIAVVHSFDQTEEIIQKLSPFGGDEDYVILVRPPYNPLMRFLLKLSSSPEIHTIKFNINLHGNLGEYLLIIVAH